MSVSLFFRKPAPLQVTVLRACIEALLLRFRMKGAELELSLVGATRIRSLNRKYRKKDRVTDVLSFPLDSQRPRGARPWQLGEVVIALPVAKRQARRAKRSLTQQALRLAVHGLVHLQGHDHEQGESARRKFEALESKYLTYLSKGGWLPWDGSLRL